mmetsp:Transcript_27506/g.69082  ORF Transcript_27506/g.69082 Transcript_27506/m.69082 type:complete len:313 (-) Transcript_27506:126-1064(-)
MHAAHRGGQQRAAVPLRGDHCVDGVPAVGQPQLSERLLGAAQVKHSDLPVLQARKHRVLRVPRPGAAPRRRRRRQAGDHRSVVHIHHLQRVRSDCRHERLRGVAAQPQVLDDARPGLQRHSKVVPGMEQAHLPQAMATVPGLGQESDARRQAQVQRSCLLRVDPEALHPRPAHGAVGDAHRCGRCRATVRIGRRPRPGRRGLLFAAWISLAAGSLHLPPHGHDLRRHDALHPLHLRLRAPPPRALRLRCRLGLQQRRVVDRQHARRVDGADVSRARPLVALRALGALLEPLGDAALAKEVATSQGGHAVRAL